ncbi:MAG: FtsX-like permease family protein [Saprospiraceae bacterium]
MARQWRNPAGCSCLWLHHSRHSSIVVNSFNYNLQRDIDSQAASLLGADLVVSGNRPLSPSQDSLLATLSAEKAEKQEIFSMAYFPRQDASQFIRLQGIQGNFPFYGQLNTLPADAPQLLQQGRFAIVDKNYLEQNGIQIGDTLRIGQTACVIKGQLLTDFASASIGAGFAPSVYVSLPTLALSQLVQPGSLVNYNAYFKTPKSFDAQAWADTHEQAFREDSQRIQTIEGQKQNLSSAFSNLNAFLNLVALVSLILGCIGVASSILIYVRSKIPSVAVLRCLGMKGSDVFATYLLQMLSIGSIGVVAGIALGTMVQLLLPVIFKDFLPLEVQTTLSWRAIAEGGLVGMLITLWFAMLPLLPVRNISPLRILRADMEEDIAGRDPLVWWVYALIAATIAGFLWYLTGAWQDAAALSLGLLVAFGVLFGVARFITWGVRRFFPVGWSFVFRQGLANLYRPNNQTTTLLVSLGLGTAILTTLFIVQGLLLSNVAEMDAGNQPNMILYGIEKDQLPALQSLTDSFQMPVIQQVPIVTMRISGWQGKTKAEWLKDTTLQAKRWAFNREIRTTFRDTIDGYEEVLAGQFPKPRKAHGDSIFISLEDGFAEDMHLNVGDEVVFNVQGMPVTTYVGSLRKVDFTRMRTRFFVIFPEGVLENAPQFQVLVTKSPDPATTERYRTAVVRAFPNVSAVDLSSILTSLNGILSKVSYVIQFMALFSLLTGIIVLISSLMLSRMQRIKETVLLRTLGAGSRQLIRITAVEYALLGSLAAFSGILLALASSWVLATQQFELDFHVPWAAILLIFAGVLSAMLLIGFWNNRSILNRSPLEVLRNE